MTIRLQVLLFAVGLLIGLVYADRAGAHAPQRVTSKMTLRTIEHRVAYNLRHSRAVVRQLESVVVGELTVDEQRELYVHRAQAVWQARTLKRVRSQLLDRMTWREAVAIVDRHLGFGSWLLSCSAPRSEGGYGRWVWNGGYRVEHAARWRILHGGPEPGRPAGSSGAGGWLQFLRSTFDSVIAGGVVRARRAGLHVPGRARSWWHPLGQAVAAVEMLHDGRRGEWAGYGC